MRSISLRQYQIEYSACCSSTLYIAGVILAAFMTANTPTANYSLGSLKWLSRE